MAEDILKNNPFKGLKDKKVNLELKIGDEVISIVPEVGDAELFMSLNPKGDIEETKKITELMVNMITRSYPDANVEDVKAYIAMNYADAFQSVAILYGFGTKKDIENAKKKIEN